MGVPTIPVKCQCSVLSWKGRKADQRKYEGVVFYVGIIIVVLRDVYSLLIIPMSSVQAITILEISTAINQ